MNPLVEEIEAQNTAENMPDMTALKASPIPHWIFPTTNGIASEVWPEQLLPP